MEKGQFLAFTWLVFVHRFDCNYTDSRQLVHYGNGVFQMLVNHSILVLSTIIANLEKKSIKFNLTYFMGEDEIIRVSHSV